MAVKTYNAGVKEYRQTYWTPDYTPLDTDILACFKITPQAGVPREEVAAAVAANPQPAPLDHCVDRFANRFGLLQGSSLPHRRRARR